MNKLSEYKEWIRVRYVWMRLLMRCSRYYLEDVLLGLMPIPNSFAEAQKEVGDRMWNVMIMFSIETDIWPEGIKEEAKKRGLMYEMEVWNGEKNLY